MHQRYFEATKRRLTDVVKPPHNTSLVPEAFMIAAEIDLFSTGRYKQQFAHPEQRRYEHFRYVHEDHGGNFEELPVRVGTTTLDLVQKGQESNLESVVLIHSSTPETSSGRLPTGQRHDTMGGRDLLYVLLHNNGVISVVYFNQPQAIALSWYPTSQQGFGRFSYPPNVDYVLPPLVQALRHGNLQDYLREPTFRAMPRFVELFMDVYRLQLE
ncbi:hypothetical protein HYY69_03310 [Candidatus Woesearchaeota archaeon]|nr:hypothetical protein [Candidatus Woesearchaeota archaeon]